MILRSLTALHGFNADGHREVLDLYPDADAFEDDDSTPEERAEDRRRFDLALDLIEIEERYTCVRCREVDGARVDAAGRPEEIRGVWPWCPGCAAEDWRVRMQYQKWDRRG